MKEFQGTPGPWVVNEIGQHWNNKALAHLEITFGEDGECICDTVYQREDANLIAAAPELLEALQELISGYEDREQSGMFDMLVHGDLIEKANVAINKALGEKQ